MTANEFFSRLAAEPFVPNLRGVRTTLGFQVGGAGTWRVSVDDGTIAVDQETGPVECTVSCDEPDLVDILLGRRNTITTLMQGRLAYRGPIVHLVHLNEILLLGPTLARITISEEEQAVGEVHP